MAGRISELAALAAPVAADLIEVLDVSDTSLAPTGTNKKVTLGTAVAARVRGALVTNVSPTAGTPPTGGIVTVAHGLGLVPAAIVATPYNSAKNTSTMVIEDWDATNFTASFYNLAGSVIVGPDTVSFTWMAVA